MNIHCKYDSLVECRLLKPHPKNRNKHPENQIERLAKILKYQGVRAPIVVSNRSERIVKGHGTLQAIKKNGWDKAPVVYQDFEDDDQEWLFVQSDNAIANWAELDLKGINADLSELGPFDIDLIGIKDFEVEPLDKLLGDDDAVPNVKPTDIKLGDLFVLGDHRLLCGDCTNELHLNLLTQKQQIDLAYLDPPYGSLKIFGKNKEGNWEAGANELAKQKKYSGNYRGEANFNREAFLSAVNHLKTKYTVIWGGNYFCDLLPIRTSWLVWNKKASHNMYSDFELAWSNLPIVGRSFEFVWQGMIRQGNKEERVHPTQKPTQLHEWAFELSKGFDKINTVIDLTGGSGSTLIACEKTNRKCFMMELDPQYCQVIIDRWEQYTGKKAVKHGSPT